MFGRGDGRDGELMTTDSDTDRENRTADVGRRNLLRAVGAGTALTALGGLASGATADSGGGDRVDPTFGFPAVSGDVEPPVEADHTVQLMIRPREGAPVPEFFFEPTGLRIESGDTVAFEYVTPHHTVTAYHGAFGFQQRVPEGVPPFSSPVLPAGGYWLYTFEEEGVYDYHCGPHEILGHAGRIVVGSPDGFEPLPDLCAEGGGGGEGEGRLPAFTAYTVLTDPALDPARIVEQGSVSWDDLDPASKQLFLQITGFPPCDDGC